MTVEIPSDLQSRINSIIARFEPAALTTPSTTAATGAGSFGSVLNQALGGATSATTGLTGMASGTDVNSLLGSATASRSAALGIGVDSYPSARGSTSALSSIAGLPGAAGTGAATPTTYENGKLPDSALVPIGVGSHRLAPDAALAFRRMSAAANADGVDIGVTDSYRTYESQVDVAKRKGLYSQGGLAAKPGTSDHGMGLALDLDLDAKAQSWMRANGSKFGYIEDTPREPWHWKFEGN